MLINVQNRIRGKKNTFSLAIKTDTCKDSSGMGIVNVEVAFDRK